METVSIQNLSTLFTYLNDQAANVLWIRDKTTQRQLYINSQQVSTHKRKAHHRAYKTNTNAAFNIRQHIEFALGIREDKNNYIPIDNACDNEGQACILVDDNQQVVGYAGISHLLDNDIKPHTESAPSSDSGSNLSPHYITLLGHKTLYEITPKEMECIVHMMAGRSAKQTAVLMNVSQRTVEFHLDNIKEKTCCRTKIELLAKIKDIA